MRRSIVTLVFVLVGACGRSDPAVLLNAPPDLDGARVYVDETYVGVLETAHSYRWGLFADKQEMAAPPRYEANLAIERLSTGAHRLRIEKPGYVAYRGTFRTASEHVEVFVPDEAARKNRG